MADGHESRTVREWVKECQECGSETCHLKFNEHGDVWAECTECGRPSTTVGIGVQKLREWDGGASA